MPHAQLLSDSAHPQAAHLPTGEQGEPMELVQSTAPVHNQIVEAVPLTAFGVAVPSAEQLAGAAHSVDSHAPQHNQVVAQVLVDALTGGANGGQDVGTLLELALPHAGGHGGSLALAALGHGLTPALHAADAISAGFAMAHPGLAMDPLTVHPDVGPTHA